MAKKRDVPAFRDDWMFLSNFYPCKIVDKFGKIWSSSEHAYQGMKFEDPTLKEKVRVHPSKGLKKFVKMHSSHIRADWDKVKLGVMYRILMRKFEDSFLQAKLIDTGDEKLVETNYWHDNFWGICMCPDCRLQGTDYEKGKNNLGKILMKIRDNYSRKVSNLKIMVTGHRPPKVGGYDDNSPQRCWVRGQITHAIIQIIMNHYKVPDNGPEWELACSQTIGISGGALGVDTDFARACKAMNIPYDVYVPCLGHSNNWPQESREKYQKMLSFARRVVMVSNKPYSPVLMHARNTNMINDCDVAIAVWDGSDGGTGNCVRGLKIANKPVMYIDPRNFR